MFSAGTHPAQVRVEAVAVMRDLGIDISGAAIETADGIRRAESSIS